MGRQSQGQSSPLSPALSPNDCIVGGEGVCNFTERDMFGYYLALPRGGAAGGGDAERVMNTVPSGMG